VGGRLVRDDVGRDLPRHQLRQYVGGIGDQPNGARLLLDQGFLHHRHRFLKRVDHHVHVGGVQPTLGTPGIHLYDESHALVHRDSQRLRAPHLTQPRGEDKLSF